MTTPLTVPKLTVEEFLASDLDVTEVSLYLGLAVVNNRQQLTNLGLGDVCRSQRLESQQRRSCTDQIPQCPSSVTLTARSTTKDETRLMFSVALEQLIIVESHIYNFDCQLLAPDCS